ncbi:PREDICTED: adenosine receptor A1-like, partial [Chlamydotis macqueenii]|uniref:adenosine receptor A1-like n=1 Tax=Chlamydotis macqueenii TaxID=187382 RepID=UPI00052A07FE
PAQPLGTICLPPPPTIISCASSGDANSTLSITGILPLFSKLSETFLLLTKPKLSPIPIHQDISEVGRYKSVVTPRRAAVAIACCWIVSFLVGLTPMFGWNNLNKMRRTQELNASHAEFVIKCQFETVISMEYMVYFNFFVWVLPPLLLMLLIYLEVFNLIRKQLNKKVSSSSNDPQKYYGKELKIAKSLALVLFLFALSWLPLHILNCITLFCPSCETPHILTYIAIFLTHGNSAMNPIVYAFRIKKFRTAFLQIWNQYFCCKTNKNASTTTAELGN